MARVHECYAVWLKGNITAEVFYNKAEADAFFNKNLEESLPLLPRKTGGKIRERQSSLRGQERDTDLPVWTSERMASKVAAHPSDSEVQRRAELVLVKAVADRLGVWRLQKEDAQPAGRCHSPA